MKKLFQSLLLTVLLFSTNVLYSYAQSFNCANELQIYMRQNFIYHADTIVQPYFDYFQTPDILEFSKIGDCDDFATYSWHYLWKMGMKADRYILYIEKDEKILGHAITVFLDIDNTYSVFTNQYILKTLAVKPVDAIKDVYINWVLICNWYPTKYGLITYDEFKTTINFCDAKELKYQALYLLMKVSKCLD